MKKLLFLSLLLLPSLVCGATKSFTEFSGGVDIVTPEKLMDKYSPFDGILNVRTDRYGMVITRTGRQKDNAVPLTGLQKVRRGYVYSKANGDSYKIWASSNSVFASKGDGNYTAIITTLSTSYTPDFTTINDTLYITNGFDNVSKWDGSVLTTLDVTNSTNVPKGRYSKWWKGRFWVWGVDSNMSRLYYSEALIPDYFDQTNYIIDLERNDGDIATGLYISGNSLIVTKKYSTFRIIEGEIGDFQPATISKTIGCLYNTSMITYLEAPCWVSHRGIEHYTNKFNLISEPIDGYVKALRQLNDSQQVWTQTSAADWGAGSGVNVDTTTYSGSVAMGSQYEEIKANSDSGFITTFTDFLANQSTWTFRQSFRPMSNCIINSFSTRLYNQTENGNFYITISSVSTNILVSSYVYVSTGTNWELKTVPITPITLTSETTYYLTISSGTIPVSKRVLEGEYYTWYSAGIFQINEGYQGQTDTYTRGKMQKSSSTVWNDVEVPPQKSDIWFTVNITTYGSYTSQSQDAANWGTWGTWGNFNISETKPAGSSINYYAVTSTSSYNLGTNTAFPVTNGLPIASSVGGWIKIISSYTCTDASAIPMTNEYSVYWYGLTDNWIQSTVYKDRLYVAISTNNTTQRNDVILVRQLDGSWTKDTGNVGGWAVHRGRLFSGSSLDDGQILENEVSGLYTDNSSGYESYWATKFTDCDLPYQEKIFSDMWVAADNSGNWDLNLDYRVNSSTGSFSSRTLNLYNPHGIVRSRIAFPLATKGYDIQVRFRNSVSGQYFKIKRLDLIYQPEPAR